MFSNLDVARYQPSEFHPCRVAPSRPATACIDAGAPGSRIAKLITDFPIAHQRLRQGEHLFRAGATFHSLYVLNAGFAKTCHVSEDGHGYLEDRRPASNSDPYTVSALICRTIILDE